MQPDQESNSGDIFNVPEGLCRQFSLAEILAATNDFNDSLVIGQGGFAKVYKGKIDNGTHTVAIKKSKSMSHELWKEFRDEILMVSKFRHSHLVSLLGYCDTDNKMILVYEYMAGGTLNECLHKIGRNGNNKVPLCWEERLKICIGAARGLDYLHTGTGINKKVIHRDVKSSNILLDEDRSTAKISDFGLSKISPANQADTRVISRVVGTFGYLDPDYYTTGFLTSKSDVYGFGVVLFEVLCGRPAVDSTLNEDQHGLAGWACFNVKIGKVEQIIDPNLKSEILPRSLSAYVKIADSCLKSRPEKRPTMTEVLAELLLALSLQESGKGNGKKAGGSKIAESGKGSGMTSGGSKITESGKENAKKAGGSKIAQKLLQLFSAKPRPIPGNNSAEFDVIEAASSDREAVKNKPVVVPSIQLDELMEITDNFGTKALISKGNCGESYHGILESGQASFIKKLFFTEIPAQELLTQVFLLSELKHENVVELLHTCVDGGVCILVYEYAPNGSLHDNLHGPESIRDLQPAGPFLSWSERVKIAVGAAKGLEYFHEEAQPNIIHGAIKSSNILIFNDGVAKIKAPPEPLFHIPWPRRRNKYDALDSKGDVYDFGVVLLELLTGRKAVDYNLPLEDRSLVHWATPRLSKDKVKQCIDPRLNRTYPRKEAAMMAAIASLCVEDEASLRPSMSIVVKHLQTLVKATPGPG